MPFSLGELMEMLTGPMHTLRSGEISVLRGEREILHLNIEDKRIDVDLQDIQPIRDLLNLLNLKKLKQLKGVAEKLREDGLTITVSHKGDIALKLGAEANPRFARLITLSNAIEISSMGKLIQIIKEAK
jgi:predicted MPP superfamily phosphohydrolase